MRLPLLARRRPELALTDRGRALVAAGVTLAVAGALLGFVDLVRVGVLLVVLPLCAVVVNRWGRPVLTVRREVRPAPVPAGTRAQVDVLVTHTGSRRCGPCLVEDTVLPAGPSGFDQVRYQRFALPALARGGSGRLRYELAPQRRGRHELGPLRVHVADPFGLTRYSTIVPGTAGFVALTRITPLTGNVSAPEGEESSDLATLVVAGSGEPSSTVREYRHGDDPRRIHWTASARTGDLLVRVEEQASADRAVLVLDQRFAARAGHAPAALDWAVEALASVAGALAVSGHVIHLVCDERLDDVRLLHPVEADEAVRVLSCATPIRPSAEDPGRVRRLREAANELAAEGGLVIAAVPDVPAHAAAVLAGRPPRSTGLAFVLSTSADGGIRPVYGGPGEREGPVAVAASATATGWHAVPVDPATTGVAEAWAHLSQMAVRSVR